ncbi:uncharacterized protein LOC134829096 [Culicoides brevitarsis]|uniref:uncharacterized protein LOC134829096 n=1 Tax=Culicoides brevitarsis TaxID=469753 RepID=UPI00307BD25A
MKTKPCKDQPPLTYIRQIWENDTAFLHINFSSVESYNLSENVSLKCCYQEIRRSTDPVEPDNKVDLTDCRYFNFKTQLSATAEFLLVQCKKEENGSSTVIYKNAHAMLRRKPEVHKRIEEKLSNRKTIRKPINVLLIGVDSISRINLLRLMPKTAQHLHDSGWMELKGYNKIDSNTLPNLMAVLTGFNLSVTENVCEPKKQGKLNSCPILWNNFRDQGYATAYAEDYQIISTFDYHKPGFATPPTDHYFRPFVVGAENFLHEKKSGDKLCLGYQYYADFIYQYALDFAKEYKDKPYFGLFWTNSFSHEDISTPSSMDEYMRDYLIKLNNSGILNETIVVFFSDHGMRFGDILKLVTGWYEERLPLIFFSLPEWFKIEYPEFAKNLKVNADRLTTPFDFHMTLNHILSLSADSNNTNDKKYAELMCPKSQSLFHEIPSNRSCNDACIPEHWCACKPYENFNKSSLIIKNAVNFAIQKMNQDLIAYKKSHNATERYSNKCAELKFKEVIRASILKLPGQNFTHYRAAFVVSPSDGEFDFTVKHDDKKDRFELAGDISRINRYNDQGKCIQDIRLIKYCYCEK